MRCEQGLQQLTEWLFFCRHIQSFHSKLLGYKVEHYWLSALILLGSGVAIWYGQSIHFSVTKWIKNELNAALLCKENDLFPGVFYLAFRLCF